MTPRARAHVTELYAAWLLCYGRPPTGGEMYHWAGVAPGMAWAWLWRLGVL